MPTLSQQDAARRQREYPLSGYDRAAELFDQLCPLPDAALGAMRDAGNLVVAEIGLPVVNAKTFHLPAGNHVIVLFTGLIDFYKQLAAILDDGTSQTVGERYLPPMNPPAVTMRRLTALFHQSFPQQSTALPSVGTPTNPASSPGLVGTLLAKASLALVLSHELGHVRFYKPSPGRADSKALTLRQEFLSDSSALQQLTRAASNQNERRISLTGVFLALRVLAVFGDLGCSFPPGHPSPISRLHALSATARTLWPSEREFWSNTPIAYAYDEMLEDVGLQVLGTGRRTAVTTDRAFSRLSAALEAAVKQQITPEKLLNDISPDLLEASSDTLEAVAAIAARMFPLHPVTTADSYQDDLWSAKSSLLRQLAPRWPIRPEPLYNYVFHPTA